MLVCQVFVWFVIYSIVGWIWESTYCTIVERKWQNRGFLYGPACPIYGTGIVAIMILWHQLTATGTTPEWYHVFLTTMVGSAVLEYVTHWALEKLFHAYWWDYSNMPLNLNGRICLPASVFFGLGGLLIVYVLYQPTVDIIQAVDPLATEAISLLLMGVMAADAAVTAASLASIASYASSINRSVNAHMDQFVADVQVRGAEVRQGIIERRDETADALATAALTARRQGEAAVERLVRHDSPSSDSLALERKRFAKSLRAARMSEMNGLMRLSARRAFSAVSPDKLPDSPNKEQLAKLWRDMLEEG